MIYHGTSLYGKKEPVKPIATELFFKKLEFLIDAESYSEQKMFKAHASKKFR